MSEFIESELFELFECALCYAAGDEEHMYPANITFAYDVASSGVRRVCADRDSCNERRMEHLWRAAGRAS